MKVLIVPDLHGKIPSDLECMSLNFDGPVVFLGDIVGTDLLDQLQKLFYNGVYNHIKKLLKSNPNSSYLEILNFPTENGKNLFDGLTDIWSFLDNLSPHSIIYAVESILEISKYQHFGHFVSCLPIQIRQILQKDMEANAQKVIDLMTNFTNRGQKVYVIEGNWDARTPLDFYPTKDECKPLPIEERSFYFKKILNEKNPNVLYFDTVTTIKVRKDFFVFWPFDSSTQHTQVPEIEKSGGKIILFSHGQADWHAVKGDTPMTSEGAKIQEVMAEVIKDLKPDYIVHGHLHDNKPDYLYNGIPVIYCPLQSCRIIDF